MLVVSTSRYPLCLAVKPYMLQETKRIIYFSYFHSVMAYGIIFWSTSPLSINLFRLQKRVSIIITNSRNTDSCRELFKKLQVLPLISQYIFSLLLFVVKNREQLKFNSEIHNNNTRYNNFHYPICNLTVFQKGTYYFGMKVFNNLPSSIKNLNNDTKQFRFALKNISSLKFILLIGRIF
jgi:hypothetical protein